VAGAQTAPARTEPVSRVASLAPGSIEGIVRDDRGQPVSGAMVTALGASTAFAVTDRAGHFVLRTLSPGPYLVRAHSTGFVVSRGEIIDVRPSGRASSTIALRRSEGDPSLLAAGFVPVGDDVGGSGDGDDHSETAWRLRHARRSILKDATEAAVAASDAPDNAFVGPAIFLGRAATSFFTETPFSGQLNFLTTGTFDSPLQMFTPDGLANNVAYVSVGSPVGSHADWVMHGALTQGDISSWIVAGSYASRALSAQHYEVGLSYAAQRYGTDNPAVLRDVTDASRSAGTVYGYDTLILSPAVSATVGGRYARYDYLQDRSLVSPRFALTIAPAGSHVRLSGVLSSSALAPGAEEFLPPDDHAIWLPPQRTFSSMNPEEPLQAERTTHAEFSLEQDIAASTLTFRAFRQHVHDQLVTMFDVQVAGAPDAQLGHYLVGNGGEVDILGWGAGFRTILARRIHGSVEYSESHATWEPGRDLSYLLLVAPSAVRLGTDRIRDLSTAVETEVPETSTRVMVLYRISDGFVRRDAQSDRPAFDSRFDVQVRQALPFMNFSNARWEALVGVRDFFHSATSDQSIYDELLVVRPPKRVMGGLTLKF
jgi:hypothetical protein